MLTNRKRKVPAWMKGSNNSNTVTTELSKNGVSSPKSPVVSSAVNGSSLNNPQNGLFKDNSCDIAVKEAPPLRYSNDNLSDGEEDERDKSTPTKRFADSLSEDEENCEAERHSRNSDDENISNSDVHGTSMNMDHSRSIYERAKDEHDNLVSPKPCTPNSRNNAAKDVGADAGARVSPGTSVLTSPATRKSCLYGSSCYRKNPQHKVEFAHPGDSDYCDSSGTNTPKNDAVTSTSDVRPLCEYGSACYRKNPQHRRDFRHDTPRKRTARPVDMQDIPSDDDGDFNSGCESDNFNPGESESDDSFITSDSVTDGSSDGSYDAEEEEKPKKRKKKADKRKGRKKVKGD
ncbi:aprataxin and PNK-like factor [Frankliniella occidentalis]|uniref:Aprataxin and PNK-like factor n=1 Tax=Frankliniella occidentalis TaxID=133901 RepID=A0A6J1SYE4_FRAOC|nr:aprataxin and PNK-like factor [Frankliniella occidentalis]